MYRRRTVDALVRQHVREKEALLAVIREQNDRLMHLAGRPWALPPRDPAPVREDEDTPSPYVLDPEQLTEV